MHRVYLSTNKKEFKKFYWFDLKDDNLYFGASSKRKEAYCEIVQSEPGKVILDTCENFKTIGTTQTKYSYHQSGKFHAKKLHDGKYCLLDLEKYLVKPANLNCPKKIFTFFSAELNQYKNCITDLSIKTGAKDVILVENADDCRLYFEIFLVPKESFTLPDSLIKFGQQFELSMSTALSANFGLFFRYTKILNLNGDFSGKEVIIINDY